MSNLHTGIAGTIAALMKPERPSSVRRAALVALFVAMLATTWVAAGPASAGINDFTFTDPATGQQIVVDANGVNRWGPGGPKQPGSLAPGPRPPGFGPGWASEEASAEALKKAQTPNSWGTKGLGGSHGDWDAIEAWCQENCLPSYVEAQQTLAPYRSAQNATYKGSIPQDPSIDYQDPEVKLYVNRTTEWARKVRGAYRANDPSMHPGEAPEPPNFSLSEEKFGTVETFPAAAGEASPVGDIFPTQPAGGQTLTLPGFPLPTEQQIVVYPSPLPQEQTQDQVSPPPMPALDPYDIRGRPIFLPIFPAYGLQELLGSLLGTPLQQLPLPEPRLVCC